MNVKPTSLRDDARDLTDCGVGVLSGGTRNSFGGAAVTIDKPCEDGNSLVAHLGARIRGQNIDEVSHNIDDAKIFVTTPFARETVQGDFADGPDTIV